MNHATAERYITAVERENERNRLYDNVIAAQIAHSVAKQAADDAAYALRVACESLEDFEAAA